MTKPTTTAPGFSFQSNKTDPVDMELTLTNVPFFVRNNTVCVRLPVAFWEAMRRHAVADLQFAHYSFAQIYKHVEGAVQARLTRQPMPSIDRFLQEVQDATIYGDISTPREEQIKKGIAYYQQRSNEQRALEEEIDQLAQAYLPKTAEE